MQLLPYRKLELRSSLAADEVLRRLAEVVQPQRRFSFTSPGTCPFEGTVTRTRFEIQRVISYRNSFLPQIQGTVTQEAEGSRISLTMQLHVAVAVFISVWLGAVFLASLGSLAALLSGNAGLAALIPVGMLLFGSLLTIGGFTPEARKAEQLLTELFGGT